MKLAKGLTAGLLTIGAFLSSPVKALETDQYLTWNIELKDSSQAFNDYLNNELIPNYLEKVNEGPNKKPNKKSKEELISGLYNYAFHGLYSSRVKHFLNTSDEIDRFPDKSVSYRKYKRESIYRSNFPFPWFFLPMSRTINLNGNYLGVDKIGHFFGFGERYFHKYTKLRGKGINEQEAVEKVINRGIALEELFVGSIIDGVFSPADLEANYQGFIFARDLSSSEEPYFELSDGKWKLARNMDITKYINPDFDESYNQSLFSGLRKQFVQKRIKELYTGKEEGQIVNERFERYSQIPHSFSYGRVKKDTGKRKRTK
ncbi:MAG: hypothetical protein AABW91_00040 [Nanoarchaeota archaeon]